VYRQTKVPDGSRLVGMETGRAVFTNSHDLI
jgi:hypothetical protein